MNTELVNSSTVDTGLQQLCRFNDAPVYEYDIEMRFRRVIIRENCPYLKPGPPGRCPQSRPGLPGERGGELWVCRSLQSGDHRALAHQVRGGLG